VVPRIIGNLIAKFGNQFASREIALSWQIEPNAKSRSRTPAAKVQPKHLAALGHFQYCET
jgi:hypothetical protein